MYRIGYNTNGLAHHRPIDALRVAAELGYEALALTPDPGCLDPLHLQHDQVEGLGLAAEDHGIELVIETGSRYLLDANRKHFPTLLEVGTEDRARRVDFLKRCVDLAALLGAPVVSVWSGAAPEGVVSDWRERAGDPEPGANCERPWRFLCEGLEQLMAFAKGTGVRIALEPEPGMFVARTKGYGELLQRLGSSGDGLGLTLDVGHCLVTGDSIPGEIEAWKQRLVNVHLDDIKDSVHNHRMFGEGELDLGETLRCLVDADFGGVASVELSRDSHRGPVAAAEAMMHIRRALGSFAS
ncbi:MAG: sugar phosphate isomerase/epimerase [Planctomycetota bacterium]|jgi:L-ribulose-5-phosphate 3-epimerase|nr:sugar phosphate isomerase/epimerase [Planctomycetota bacterium]MDG2142257.1 sugar phosphate isomerase/epimerase [Planctomycetota bacterium]